MIPIRSNFLKSFVLIIAVHEPRGEQAVYMVRLSADEYYAIRDVQTRTAYWNSVKAASLEEGDIGKFWRNYMENSGINL